jgi:hypothetical protein
MVEGLIQALSGKWSPAGTARGLHAEVRWRFCTQAWSSAQADNLQISLSSFHIPL